MVQKAADENRKKLSIIISYVTAPDEAQYKKIINFLSKKYEVNINDMKIDLEEEPKLLGGFIIRVGNQEYDCSMRGLLNQVKQEVLDNNTTFSSSEEIISLLRTKIENLEFEKTEKEIGFVKRIGDGIVAVDGIDHAMFW